MPSADHGHKGLALGRLPKNAERPAVQASRRRGHLRKGRVPITVRHQLNVDSFSMRWVFFALLVSLIATCGQKGPLHLPEDEPEGTVGGGVAAVGGGSS